MRTSSGPADREQSPDDGRPSTSSQPSRRGPALKRQLDQVHDSHQSAEDEMPMRKRTRMDQQVQTPPAPGHRSPALFRNWFEPISSEESASQESQNRSVDLTSLLWSSGEHLSLHWSGLGQGQIVEDQTTATGSERHAEDNILSRYEMGRMIGEGAYGSVYAGKRLEDGLEVAVKIVRKPQNLEYINIPGHPAPFPLEVGLLILANGGPKVSEIIELLDWQDQPDQYIMVLERPSSCEDLWHFSRRHREGILDEDTARRIMAQATTAAHVCCRRGVFHRDVKLENLLINTETLEVKLIDFGCGDLLQEAGYERFSGTISYRPPEHYTEGKYHGKPATVWSLGVLLFLLVCGRFPGPKDRQTIEDDIWSDPGLSNAPVHHSPVSPAPGHNNRVDETTEGEFTAMTSNIKLTAVHATKLNQLFADNILSRYKMGRMIGEGSYGSVYEGKRLEDGLEVAVKIVRKPQNLEYINIPGHPAPFPLEVGLLILANGGPKVSEIIELLDWQDQPDQYIMVLERPSSCEDLWHFSRRHHEGILDEDTARRIMAQATTAAHVCCRRGVFHRDVKLENLLINTKTLEVKLIDFGCGDLLKEAGYERFSGTISYRPPEHYTEGKYHGKPATVWSLGVLLFLLVCGRFPGPRDRQTIEDDIWSDPGLSNGHRRRDEERRQNSSPVKAASATALSKGSPENTIFVYF
ncbi:unnamed protein product [Leuciscus chuanchicus]